MRLVILDSRDNVATAPRDLPAGATAIAGEMSLEIPSDVPRGHKVALEPIARGADVIRYGEIIGIATADVSSGEHVHVHNLVSRRLPGSRQ